MNKLLPGTLALALVPAAIADINPLLEEIVVTSSRVPMPLRQIGTSVSVVTDVDIQERGFFSLADVLRYEPGISVTNTGGVGAASFAPSAAGKP